MKEHSKILSSPLSHLTAPNQAFVAGDSKLVGILLNIRGIERFWLKCFSKQPRQLYAEPMVVAIS